jgi:hypothetical protein
MRRLLMAELFCWRTLGEVEREHILLAGSQHDGCNHSACCGWARNEPSGTKQRGRPRSGQNPILNQVRLSPELIELLSRRALVGGTTRSELIRRLLETGLHEMHHTHGGLP